jgi:hypothetical protein
MPIKKYSHIKQTQKISPVVLNRATSSVRFSCAKKYAYNKKERLGILKKRLKSFPKEMYYWYLYLSKTVPNYKKSAASIPFNLKDEDEIIKMVRYLRKKIEETKSEIEYLTGDIL